VAAFINNQAATDNYFGAGALVLDPSYNYDSCTVLVSGNPAAMQFFVGEPGSGRWTEERDFVAPAGNGTTNSLKVSNIHGIRVKNANPGAVAIVSVTLYRSGGRWDSDDPIFEAGSLSPGTITASGTVNPGQASVEIDKNGVAIGSEPKLDFQDVNAMVFTVTDESGNQRVKVSGPKVITGLVNGDGTIANGSGFAAVHDSTGQYTISFTASFAGTPLVIATAMSNNAQGNINVHNILPGSFEVAIALVQVGSGGGFEDLAFSFLAFALA
jgi:hypothetical protein